MYVTTTFEASMDNNSLLYGFSFHDNHQHQLINSINEIDLTERTWVHLDYSSQETEDWLTNESRLNPIVISALLNEETRPRATFIDDGILISLRGVNLAPNSDPEDMVSLRIWVDKHKVISTRQRNVMSAKDVAQLITSNVGPNTPVQVVLQLAHHLMSRMTDTIHDIEEKLSDFEENVLTNATYQLKNEIADLRRQVISLRRYLLPQREAIHQLQSEQNTLFSSNDKVQLRETADQLIRYIEDLETIRDRAAISQEELANHFNEQLNNRMYVLSIVAAIFLPLGFLTGLLGVNVGGIPGADDTNAFIYFIIFLIVVVGVQVILFKRNKWF